ncbi:hypothetical protein [Vibrio sp. 03_296]|nr:hypothetical protein [Vibrio sp. 03_296]
MNNVGDPFVDGNYTVNTKFVERMVLDYFAFALERPNGHRKDHI